VLILSDATDKKSRHESHQFSQIIANHTPDMGEQGCLLNQVADLVDAGRIQSTLQTDLGTINAANMRRAHALVESGKTIGKIVLCG